VNQEQLSDNVQWTIVLFGLSFSLTYEQWISLGVLLTGLITMVHGIYVRNRNLRIRQRELVLAEAELQHKLRRSAKQSFTDTKDQE